jgi:hypothetical protein
MAQRPWATSVGLVGSIVDLITSDAAPAPGESSDSDIIGAAQQLRATLRPFV